MQKEPQKKVLNAFQLVLRPIVKILLRYGIGYNEFAETVKTAFVEVGSTEFGIRGRPTNISRVAVMTGLTRKEVRRIRTKIESGDNAVRAKNTPISEILTRWHSELEYLDDNGRPKLLPFSDGDASFCSLVRSYGGDVPPGAMRTEMKRMNVVEELADGSLKVTGRTTVASDSTENLITMLIHGVYPHLATTVINTDPNKIRGEGNAQFAAYSQQIRSEDRPRLKRICYERLSDLAVSFDDLFASFEEPKADSNENNEADSVVAVGLYFFEEKDKNAKYKW